jgi:hypothetical protein
MGAHRFFGELVGVLLAKAPDSQPVTRHVRHTGSSNMLDFVDDDTLNPTLSDAHVYARSDPDRNKMPPIPYILLTVVTSAKDKLDQKFANIENAEDIVEKYSSDPNGDENSNLTKLLSWCWQQGTFEKIRRLSEHSFMALFF